MRPQCAYAELRTAAGPAFSARDRELVGLLAPHVAQAATDGEVARHLGISPRTVQKHPQLIYRELALTSRAELRVRLTRGAGNP
ncbi:LuxR C-terminal-related transcriptional regulator [Amycolatopsis sp. DG1A-15b]|uniref:LuxR C-terminal-related transcriptional regulator n=1 Tax=Amycolatopsis sp. DG1A-15b TaxID=3052846 RepID=UPI00255B7380|nr:LuxR C-terminal-related transcriptional regulator [Amycolatopsis sp. DG1A-15b]WIX91666.1 LuxR C-terminal-related transcriptional regulator [Amycolatopsis sp. DG1A-15b]